jgi:hypothetical protein
MRDAITRRFWGLPRHRNLPGNRPPKRRSYPGNGDDDQVRVCAACEPWSIALAPPDWRFPTEVLDDVRLVFPSQVQVPTHCGGRAGGPGALYEGATSMGVSGFGD